MVLRSQRQRRSDCSLRYDSDYMATLRVNKRQPREFRKWAAEYLEKAEQIKLESMEKAEQYSTIANMFGRLGAPMKSRKRRGRP